MRARTQTGAPEDFGSGFLISSRASNVRSPLFLVTRLARKRFPYFTCTEPRWAIKFVGFQHVYNSIFIRWSVSLFFNAEYLVTLVRLRGLPEPQLEEDRPRSHVRLLYISNCRSCSSTILYNRKLFRTQCKSFYKLYLLKQQRLS